MTLTLKESCRLYEQNCRRRQNVPSFEEFNVSHSACLPHNVDVFAVFKQNIELAYKAEGVPVTRRLPSLFKRLSTSKLQKSALLPPSVQMSVSPAPASVVPPLNRSMKMKIRAPSAPSAPSADWTLEEYRQLVLNSRDSKIKESKGLMVHLMPSTKIKERLLASYACKLTKSTWKALIGKQGDRLTMRDDSELKLSSVSLNKSDVALFVKSYKNQTQGPFFIRIS
tara:strand:- start:17646 stop:18320 length:675 start_codon:yes stop_codon:yes gene_type:complete